jgi:hypothetical protein
LKGNPSRGLRECGVLSIHLGILTVSGTPPSGALKIEAPKYDLVVGPGEY